jgi:hypothetical protein
LMMREGFDFEAAAALSFVCVTTEPCGVFLAGA